MVSVVFLATFDVLALNPNNSISQQNCRMWTRQNGLPANGIEAMTQTRDGYLWLGTQKGLVRYDGARFDVFNLPQPQFLNQHISTLCSSKDGGVWFGISGGTFGFCDSQGNFTTFEDQDERFRDPALNVVGIRELSDGSVWVSTDRWLARFRRGSTNETLFFNDMSVPTAICEGANGRVWLGTTEKGLFYWEAGKIIPFPDESLKKQLVLSIVTDAGGRIWVATTARLACYDRDLRPLAVPRLEDEVKTLLIDRQGVLWIGTSGGGLLCYKHGALTSLQQINGLAHNFVTVLFEDQEGSLWIGTREGLNQLTDVKFPIYSATEGWMGGLCHGVCASTNGGLWAATSRGVSCFDGKTASNFSTEAGLSHPYIKRAFEARNGDVYLINGNKGIEILSQGTIVAKHACDSWPTALTEDERGVVASVGGNLFRVDRDRMAPFTLKDGRTISLTWIRNLFTSRDGVLWIASVDGLLRVTDGGYAQWSTTNGLAGNDVFGVCEDSDGVIWAGLNTGLARIKNGQVRNITQADGLLDNSLYALVPDDLDGLWINSSRGILKVSRKNLNDFADGKTGSISCLAYDGLDVVKTIDTAEVEYVGCKTPDGRIWFPSPQGVIMIDPVNLPRNTVAPPVCIQRVHINGVEINGRNAAALRPGKGNLEFQYTALTYIAPEKVQFRYQLAGYDSDWIDAGGRRAAFYTNLKPGKYDFRVQACNSDGVWNTAGDSFAVELPPRFYETTWFHLLCAALASVLLAGIYTWKVRHLRRKHREMQKAQELLERKVRERTAELEAQKSQLQNEIDERKRMEREVEKTHRALLDVSRKAGQAEVASSVLHNVGNVLNSVNVATNLVGDRLRRLRLGNVRKAAELIHLNRENLGQWIAEDPKGRQLPSYLDALGKQLEEEQSKVLEDMAGLTQNVEHIKEIVSMQQTYARAGGMTEIISLAELADSALNMEAGGYTRHGISVVRDYQPLPPIITDKHRVLQILVNLLHNAKYACDGSQRPDKSVRISVQAVEGERIRIEVADNGMGIEPDHMKRIFTHGFTTRKDGHGFGLHSSVLAAQELGGKLSVHSEGPGQGAVFTLEIPRVHGKAEG